MSSIPHGTSVTLPPTLPHTPSHTPSYSLSHSLTLPYTPSHPPSSPSLTPPPSASHPPSHTPSHPPSHTLSHTLPPSPLCLPLISMHTHVGSDGVVMSTDGTNKDPPGTLAASPRKYFISKDLGKLISRHF